MIHAAREESAARAVAGDRAALSACRGPRLPASSDGWAWLVHDAGQPLPELPLALDEDQVVVIDRERTYHQAAKRVYLD
jgi:hypothetical protein